MLNRLKKQNAFVIVLEFAIIIFVVIGISYAAYSFSSNFKLKTVELGIDTEVYGDTSIDSDNIKLVPILDSEVVNNQSNVLKINFKVRGNENNVVNNIIYDIALTNLEIDCELLSKYLKWELLKNEEVISSGDFSSSFDTIIDDRLVLTDIQQDLVDFGSEPDNYEFRLWLSDSCQSSNILECQNAEDQKSLLNKSLSGRIEVQLYTGSKSELVRSPSSEIVVGSCIQNLDVSGANRPVMSDAMIAVYYDEENQVWRKADSKNSNIDYLWYDYANKRWANVVVVKDYKKYEESILGSEIFNDDIVAFYVWIPRYSYQVWNIDSKEDKAKDYLNGINIHFETGKSDSGSITCIEDSCVGNNLEYLTHPAFTKDNIKGFWISKYEISGTENEPKSIISKNSLINYSMEKALSTSLKLLDYGITEMSLEIVSNLKWGSVSYLTYSNYGICTDIVCKKDIDSTTNNIYGVYDLDSKNDEMIKTDSFVLGGATDEVGIDSSTLTESILYRNSMFSVISTKKDYGFRNILYK